MRFYGEYVCTSNGASMTIGENDIVESLNLLKEVLFHREMQVSTTVILVG